MFFSVYYSLQLLFLQQLVEKLVKLHLSKAMLEFFPPTIVDISSMDAFLLYHIRWSISLNCWTFIFNFFGLFLLISWGRNLHNKINFFSCQTHCVFPGGLLVFKSAIFFLICLSLLSLRQTPHACKLFPGLTHTHMQSLSVLRAFLIGRTFPSQT